MTTLGPGGRPAFGATAGGRAAVVVPLPAADWLVPDAHVPLLAPLSEVGPVTSGVLDELAALFADVVPFEVELSTVSRFPGGLAYLAPRPAAPFHQLSLALLRRFPDLRPAGLSFDDVVPHVPLPEADEATAALLQDRLDHAGPVRGRAASAVLRVVSEDGSVDVVAEFPFGTSAA